MAIFFIKDPQDTNIHYHGKVLPKDSKKPILQQGDTTGNDGSVIYSGKELPLYEKPYSPPIKDLTNNPSLLVIGNVTLPADVIIYINGEKIIPMSKILDGVSVTEGIMREPYELEFECVLRQANADNTAYIFAQQEVNNVWSNIWVPDSVQTIRNTFLNNLGILEIVVKGITPSTVRGSKNIPLRIRAYENVPGTTIII